MEFLLTIGVVVLFVMTINQKSRIETMEKTLAKFRPVAKKKTQTQKMHAPEVSASDGVIQEEVQTAKEQATQVFVEQPIKQTQTSNKDSVSFESLLVKKILPTVGVLSVVLGVGFLVTWSYSNGYLGPKGLVTLGALFSMGVVVTGELLRDSFPKYFAYLSSAGMLGLGVCVYASEVVYGFISSGAAFGLYILLTAASFALALRYNSRIMAFLAAFGGFLVPFLINSPDASPYTMIGYSCALLLAGAVVMYMKNWIETTLVTFGALLTYAVMMLSSVGNTYRDISVDPWIYLLWIYGAIALFAVSIVTRLIAYRPVDPDKTGDLGGQVIPIVALLVSILSVNYLGYEVFANQAWDHFGFFVLAQSFVTYGISQFLANKSLPVFEQLFTIATLAGVGFATIWELGFADYPVITALLLLAQSALYVFVRKHMVNNVKEVFTTFALVTQTVALFAVFNTANFSQMTLVLWVSVAVALYHAYTRFIEQKTSTLAMLQVVAAGVLIVIWTFVLLPGELTGQLDIILPQLLALVYVIGLLVFSRKFSSRFCVYAAKVVAVISAFAFMVNAWSFSQVGLVGAALVLGTFAAFGVSIGKRMKSHFGIEEALYRNMLGFTAITTALWLSHIAYWALSDPITSIVIMLVGVVYVVVGLQKTLNIVRFTGLCLVGYILAKMYLVDIWSWSTLWRFVAMLPMGLLLISLPFWYQKLKKD